MEFNIKARLAHAWGALVNEEIRIKSNVPGISARNLRK